jgi:hypothetical protein
VIPLSVVLGASSLFHTTSVVLAIAALLVAVLLFVVTR